MAFNPFEAMRAKSKVLMAILTIFIMFIFVLSSGLRGGDFFLDVLPRWFGLNTSGDRVPLASIAGNELRYSELEQIRTERLFATEYLNQCRELANNALFRQLLKQLEEKPSPLKLPEEAMQSLTQLCRARLAVFEPDPKSAGQDQRSLYQQYSLQMQIANFTLGRFINNPPKDLGATELDAIRDILSVVQYEGTQQQLRVSGIDIYPEFAFMPNRNLRDSAMFALVLKKADQMGIEIPPDLLRQMINSEMANRLSAQDAGRVEAFMARRYRGVFNAEMLMRGIASEYRVRMVLNNLMSGERPSLSPRPSFITPYDLFQYYKENCSLSNFWALEIPVEAFLDQVKETPKPEELKELFNKNRLVEYNPSVPTPGFKDPYKVKVEWLSGSSEAPYYVTNLEAFKAASIAISGLTATDAGGTIFSSSFAVAAPVLYESLRMQEYYQELVKKQTTDNPWDRFFIAEPRETSKNHPTTIAAIAGNLLPSASLWHLGVRTAAATTAYEQFSQAIEARDRVKVGLPIVLAPLYDGPLGNLLALAPSAASIPELLPLSSYQGQFQARLKESMLAELFQADIASLTRQLRDQGLKIEENSRPGKTDAAKVTEARTEAAKLVSEFVKSRGFKTGISTEARDRYSLVTDAGTKPLTDKVAPPRISDDTNAWRTFFFNDLLPAAQRVGSKDPLVYNLKYFPDGREPAPVDLKQTTYMAWRTEIIEPKVYETFDKAPAAIQQLVQEAWKKAKARELAKKEADAWLAKVDDIATKNLKSTPPNINGFKGVLDDELRKEKKDNYRTFAFNGITRLSQDPNIGGNPQMGSFYTDYLATGETPKEVSSQIPFPGSIARELLLVRNEPLGKVILSNDQPVDRYFVTTLVERNEMTPFDFSFRVFSKINPTGSIAERNPLYNQYALPEAERFTRDAFFESLKVEFKYTENKEELEKVVKNPDEE